VTNGQAAVRFFDAGDGSEEAPCPGLVILDINLPIKRGDEVLRHIRSSAQCTDAPVLIVSTSGSDVDRAKMKLLGCDGYFRKPSTHAEFMQLGPIVKAMLKGPV
jgi:DNA-binding response OmpR family regulator